MRQIPAAAHVRIARPTHDLQRIERFWTDGVGLEILWRTDDGAAGGHALTMVGIPDASWHLELVDDDELAARTTPSEEDLLVVYLGQMPSEEWLGRIEQSGGTRVQARNPYWETRGVTFEDPDGYRLVLSSRTWPS